MLYIVTHKKVDVSLKPGMALIQAGAAAHAALPYISDSTGDNISAKNPSYCELTALYWIWKNTTDDFKGLAHYRRFFGRCELSASMSSCYSEEELKSMLTDADIVLPNIEYMLENAREQLCMGSCRPEVFSKMREIIEAAHPDYMPAFDHVFSSNRLTLFNMMYSRRELFDSYCEWLFPILFELEKHVDMTGYTAYEKRLYGFLSERLLNVWVMKNNLRAVHTAVVQTEMPLIEKLRLLRRRQTNRLRFWLRTKR